MPSRGMAGAAAALITAASTAAAETATEFKLPVLPEQCRGVAQIPRSAEIVDPVLSARISAVNCAAQDIFGSVPVTDSKASVHALDAASAPLFAALDDVAAHGSPKWKIQALYAKGNLLFGLQTRLRNSIPAITSDTSLDPAGAIEHRHRALEPLLEPWQARALAAFAQVADIARANPPLATANPVLQYMVQRAAQIASSVEAPEASGVGGAPWISARARAGSETALDGAGSARASLNDASRVSWASRLESGFSGG